VKSATVRAMSHSVRSGSSAPAAGGGAADPVSRR
jgi:hypothetical protein